MNRDILLELAKECEAAKEPDRYLDAKIAAIVRLERVPDWARNWTGEWHATTAGSVVMMETSGNPGPIFMTSEYTGSIDAASRLVPTKLFPDLRPGQWWWQVDNLGCSAHVAYENRDSGIPEFAGEASTPALALCSAALRARADML